ncbi:MAG: TonB-dependent receptor [Bacteroidota bacterium]|nr:TonB-dependent receptor [Bacteroidota bacterium]
MRRLIRVVAFIFISLITANYCLAQKITISGHIKDKNTGEELIGAGIYIPELKTGATTNMYGFYSITINKGQYNLTVSFIGYNSFSQSVNLNKNTKIDIELTANQKNLQEIVITEKKTDENIEEVKMSNVNLKMDAIKKIPAVLGEVDVIKSILLLPGIKSAGEGGNGFFVRGGGVDQNLVLLDEAPVYNASHLLGFFSVFNPDAIKDLQIYKGGIPAQYGGRLSSLLDIHMKDGNMKKLSVSGGVGLISSRLTVEGPIVPDKCSFIISGRRTYADIFLPLATNEMTQKSKLFFYDLNAKLNYIFNDKNRLFVSGYFGRDVFKLSNIVYMNWGNTTTTARWNHLFSDKLFSNLTLVYSNYDYSLGSDIGINSFTWRSKIEDISLKYDFTDYLNPDNTFRYGFSSTYHTFNPGDAEPNGEQSALNAIKLPLLYALESALYISNEQKIGANLTLQYGLRYSIFQNIGPATIYNYNKNHNSIDSTVYSKGKIFNTYSGLEGLEPRIGTKYSLTENSSLKASYNRTRQYLNLISNSTSSTPFDIWIPSSPNVKPQLADQVALGYFKNLKKNMFETSLEVYYKYMQNQIDYKDHAMLFLNKKIEGELRIGTTWSYGMEFLIKKQEGKFTGWLGYTLSKTERNIPEINNGKTFPSRYDRTHDISVVLSYDLNERWNFSANWVFNTGSAVTMPVGKAVIDGMSVPIYSDRNGERLPAYHRLDLSATLKAKKIENRKYFWDINFSIYNAYYQKNAYQINFKPDEDNPQNTAAYKLWIYATIPSITYNFHF